MRKRNLFDHTLYYVYYIVDVSNVSHSVSAVGSQVSSDMVPHPSVMQKQLALAQKKIEAYRRQIEFLQNHVDNSEVERIFDKLKRSYMFQ